MVYFDIISQLNKFKVSKFTLKSEIIISNLFKSYDFTTKIIKFKKSKELGPIIFNSKVVNTSAYLYFNYKISNFLCKIHSKIFYIEIGYIYSSFNEI